MIYLNKCLRFIEQPESLLPEEPVRNTVNRLIKLSPSMVYPMHGSCIDSSTFSMYTEAVLKNDFAYIGTLLGQKLEAFS